MSEFWDAEPAGDVVNGRYRLPDPVTGEPTSFTRASNMSAVLADAFGLTRWQLREQLRGVGMRPDLQRLVSTFGPDTPKGELDAVAASAHEAAATGAKANNGTAIHAVLTGVDRNWPELASDPSWIIDGVPEWARPYAFSYRSELLRHGLEPIPDMVERRVCHRAVGVVGTLDNHYRESDGSVLVGDKKTTGHLDLSAGEIAVQLACYAGASWLWDDAARRWLGSAIGPSLVRQDRAVVVHVDQEHATVAVYRVDLEQGRRALNLAAQVREWRNVKGLLLPYVAPQVVTREHVTVLGIDQHGNMRTADPFAVLPNVTDPTGVGAESAPLDPVAGVNPIDHPDAARTQHPDVGPIVGEVRNVGMQDVRWNGTAWEPISNPGNEHSANSTTATIGEALASQTAIKNGKPLRTAEDLLRAKVTKAEVQQYAREHGITDLAHTKKVLVEMLDATGKLAPAGTPLPTSPARGGDPAEIHGSINGSDPTNPHDPAFHAERLKEIARAETVGAIELIRRRVVRVGGDQAWNDAMTAAARERVAVLDAPPASYDPVVMLSRCQTPQDIAKLWEKVTLGGSVPERWTDELNQAAQQRLSEIQAAQPPVPANPFAEVP